MPMKSWRIEEEINLETLPAQILKAALINATLSELCVSKCLELCGLTLVN